MALIVKDRVQELSTTVGTGTLTLGGATLGFQSFAAIGDGNTTYYAINDPITGDWEAGIGTYTASGTTLSRDTVLSSSNGGSLVSFVAGSKNVFCTYPSERSVYRDTANTYTVQQAFDALTANSIALTTGTITTAPTSNTDIVNKQYADAIATGIHFHEAVAYATTAALPACTYNNGTSGVGATLTGDANGALTVDSHTFTSPTDNGTRVLIKNQVNGAHNGVYTLTQAGNSSPGAPFILTRATDFDTVGTGVDQIDEGDFFLVTSGVINLNTAWVQQTAPPITIGTTAIVFQQFSAPITYTAGTGLNESPSFTFNIANTGVSAATYGSASQVPVFAVNAQGQITTVTDTAIAISAGAVSGLAASATTDTTNASNISSGTLGTSRLSGSYTGITGVGALAAGSLASGFTAVSAPLGGTGQTSYAVGDILYADTTTSLARLADVAVGNALISGGVSADPSWGKIGLATHVSGTLPTANGGTNLTGFTANGVVYASSTTALTTGTGLTFDGTALNLGGTGNRITGDFSNATVANRVMFQGVSGATTDVGSIPPSAASAASFIAFNSTDSGNAGFAQLRIDGGDARFASSRTGTGTYLPMTFYTGGSERMRIDTSGNVGIGTSSPGARLNIVDATSQDALRITQTGTGNALVIEDSANPDSTPFVVDADGFTVVGAATRTTGYLDYAGNTRTPILQTQGISISGGGMTATNWGNSTFPSGLFLAKSRGGSVGTRGVVLNNDNIGAVLFSGDDATNFIPGAAIFGQVDGTPGTNDMPGRLVFSTTADGASTPTEQMRLTSTGDLRFNSGYGSVATAYGCRAWVNFDGTSNSANLSGTYSRTSPSTTVFVTATSHGLITGNRVFLDFTTGTAVDGNYEVTVTGANTFTVTTVASTTTSGNVTLRRNPIRGSGNVSSISDDDTGDYTVNFATAMPDTNFGWTTGSVNAAIVTGATATVKTTASIQFVTVRSSTGAIQDSAEFCVAIFR